MVAQEEDIAWLGNRCALGGLDGLIQVKVLYALAFVSGIK
jgi:hypothetical protein